MGVLSRRAKRREQYAIYGIKDAYLLSIDEFVNRPMHEIEEMIDEQKFKIEQRTKAQTPKDEEK